MATVRPGACLLAMPMFGPGSGSRSARSTRQGTSRPPRSRFIVNLMWMLIAAMGAVWATYVADRARSWDVTCYERNNCDGLTFSVVSEMLREGHSPYLESERRAHISKTRLSGAAPPFDLAFQYPPNALPLFALRAMSSPRAAHVGTAFLTTFVFLLLASQLVRKHLFDNRQAMLLILSASFSGVLALNVELGQTGLIAAALIVAITLNWSHAPVAAGLMLGALAFKPQYAGPILVVAVVSGKWRIVAGAAGAFLASTIASGISYGFDEWSSFAAAVGQPNHTVPWMVNWIGGAWHFGAARLETLQAAALPVFVVATIALAAALWPLRQRCTIEAQLAVAVAWSVLFSPNTHPYDLLVLLPALVYVSGHYPGAKIGLLFCLISWCTLPQPFRGGLVLALAGLAVLCTYLVGRDAVSRRHGLRPLPVPLQPGPPARSGWAHF